MKQPGHVIFPSCSLPALAGQHHPQHWFYIFSGVSSFAPIPKAGATLQNSVALSPLTERQRFLQSPAGEGRLPFLPVLAPPEETAPREAHPVQVPALQQPLPGAPMHLPGVTLPTCRFADLP